MQLYEYEPILEVHRAAEEMGHSRSGERLRSVLKRTSCVLDTSFEETATIHENHNHHHNQLLSSHQNRCVAGGDGENMHAKDAFRRVLLPTPTTGAVPVSRDCALLHVETGIDETMVE